MIGCVNFVCNRFDGPARFHVNAPIYRHARPIRRRLCVEDVAARSYRRAIAEQSLLRGKYRVQNDRGIYTRINEWPNAFTDLRAHSKAAGRESNRRLCLDPSTRRVARAVGLALIVKLAASRRPVLLRSKTLALACASESARTQRFLPGGLYALATLEAFSAIDLNSAPVQALTLLTWEMAPVAEAAIKRPRPPARATISSCVPVLAGKSLTDAYAAAGYKADDGNASRLAAKPHMAARIDELKAEAAQTVGITVAEVLDQITKIARSDSPLIGARAKLKALELLGKHFGLFKGKAAHSGQISHVIILPANERFDRLTEDQPAGRRQLPR